MDRLPSISSAARFEAKNKYVDENTPKPNKTVDNSPYFFKYEPPPERFLAAPAGAARVVEPYVSASEAAPSLMTAFEKKAESLGLKPGEYESSKQLRKWVEDNHMQKYIPEHLLKVWGLKKNLAEYDAELPSATVRLPK